MERKVCIVSYANRYEAYEMHSNVCVYGGYNDCEDTLRKWYTDRGYTVVLGKRVEAICTNEGEVATIK